MAEALHNKAANGHPAAGRLLPLFILAHFCHHLLTSLPVPLLPMIKADFGLDYTRSGLVVSSFNMSYGIGQIPADWLSDRAGPRFAVMAGTCGVAAVGFWWAFRRHTSCLWSAWRSWGWRAAATTRPPPG